MSAQIALLRGVNLGKRKVVMSELRAACEAAGFTDVRTLAASGNLVLGARQKSAALEKKLETLILAELGLKTDVFVRDAKEMAAIIAANPFKAFTKKDPSHMVVVFMKAAATAAEKKALVAATKDRPEEAKAVGREVYVTYPNGIGRSELKLPTEGTMRNWNTVTKLAAMAEA